MGEEWKYSYNVNENGPVQNKLYPDFTIHFSILLFVTYIPEYSVSVLVKHGELRPIQKAAASSNPSYIMDQSKRLQPVPIHPI